MCKNIQKKIYIYFNNFICNQSITYVFIEQKIELIILRCNRIMCSSIRMNAKERKNTNIKSQRVVDID